MGSWVMDKFSTCGMEGGDILDHSKVLSKQLHSAGLNSVPVSEQDCGQYNHFAKNIHKEIRKVALGMI
jgi:hypothetical protein